MRARRVLRVDQFRGVDQSTPPELLTGDVFATDLNGDRRPQESWRVRRGRARLLDRTGAGVNFTANYGNTPRRVIQFERDDDERYLVFAGGGMSLLKDDQDEVNAVLAGEPL